MNQKFSVALLQVKAYLRSSQDLEKDFKSQVDWLKQEYPNEFKATHLSHIASALGVNKPERLWEETPENDNDNDSGFDYLAAYLQGVAEAMVEVDWVNADEIGQTLDAAYDDLSINFKSHWVDSKAFREAVKSKIRELGLVKKLATRIGK
ncbi:MAG: hypothetical protein QNJ36_17055 [Calothrix sp. MO_167.B42]|nr:hypothetical protein [Calothrix sp. MO_167.B42]